MLHALDSSSKVEFKASSNASSKQGTGATLMLGVQNQSAAVKAAKVDGKCCYSGPADCDSHRDWCSKSEAQCGTCGGMLHALDSSSTVEFKASWNASSKQGTRATLML